MVELANPGVTSRRDTRDGAAATALPPLHAIAVEAWRQLAARAVEPNGYSLPDWALAANGAVQDRTAPFALTALDPRGGALIGLVPVTSAWRALRLPLLVSADPYHSLGTPLLDRDAADAAAAGLLDRARAAGAHALLLRYLPLDGAAAQAFGRVLRARHLQARPLTSHVRAGLDATRPADAVLRDALGAKRLKELRRLRRRLGEHGVVNFAVAQRADQVAAGFDQFLALEASGWKGRRGSALAQQADAAARLRGAAIALASRGQCEVVTLSAGGRAVAAGIVLRHRDRAFFFKIGIDAALAKYSLGAQLTVELTRHLCADPQIATADSTAAPGHPMIDPIWRARLPIGDLLIPLRRNDPWFAAIEGALRTRHALRAAVVRHLQRRRPPAVTSQGPEHRGNSHGVAGLLSRARRQTMPPATPPPRR